MKKTLNILIVYLFSVVASAKIEMLDLTKIPPNQNGEREFIAEPKYKNVDEIIFKIGDKYYLSYQIECANQQQEICWGNEVEIDPNLVERQSDNLRYDSSADSNDINRENDTNSNSESNVESGEAKEGVVGSFAMNFGLGLATAIVRGALLSSENGEVADLKETIQKQIQVENSYNLAIAEANQNIYKNIFENIDLLKNFGSGQLAGSLTAFSITKKYPEYNTKDIEKLSKLRENFLVLSSIFTVIPKRNVAKNLGLELNLEADKLYSNNFIDEADALIKMARQMADIAIGLDPITGPARDIYEALTGKNLVTNEDLDESARVFAVIGCITFGFGNKIEKGLNALFQMANNKLIKQGFEKSLNYVSKVFIQTKKLLLPSEYHSAKSAFSKYPLNLGKQDVFQDLFEKNPQLLSEYVNKINEIKNDKILVKFENGNLYEVKQSLTKEGIERRIKIDKSGFKNVYKSDKPISSAEYLFQKKLTDAISNIAHEITVRQIGSNGKIAIIGRGMEDNVYKTKNVFEKNGLMAETFSGSKEADDSFKILAKSYGGLIPNNIIKDTLLFKENVDWITRIRNEGYTIIDSNNPIGLPPSEFYKMEHEILGVHL